ELDRRAETVCAPLKLRIGIATGDTMLFEGDDYIGPAPNLAARLCDQAIGIGVLIATEQIIDLPQGVKTKQHEAIKLHGFNEPVNVSVLAGRPVIAERHDTSEIWTQRPVSN
ncbi:MAG: hypothetical protein NT119_00730, partial [Actinobacteria bacterium]|nr:hypothetical protein [Actinomycetota bacterium]